MEKLAKLIILKKYKFVYLIFIPTNIMLIQFI